MLGGKDDTAVDSLAEDVRASLVRSVVDAAGECIDIELELKPGG